MNSNACVKIDGKWKTFGKIRMNKWGNPQLSFKVTPELKDLMNKNEWLNFSLFEEKEKKELSSKTQSEADKFYENAEKEIRKTLTPADEQEIPF